MSSQLPISEEALAETFISASVEIELDRNFEQKKIIAPEDVIVDFSDKIASGFVVEYKPGVKPFTSIALDTGSTITMGTMGDAFKGIVDKAKSVADELWDWFEKNFRKATDKLKELATKIFEKAQGFSVTAVEYLQRMRRHLYKWILRNSAVESFDVGTGQDNITFTPVKITSSGKFEFGRVASDINSVDDIIGLLKVIPSIAIQVMLSIRKNNLISRQKDNEQGEQQCVYGIKLLLCAQLYSYGRGSSNPT